MSSTTYYQRNTDVVLNRSKEYHKNDKERLREQARNKYRNLSENEKIKKREYGKNRYQNMSQENKQKLKEYQKKKQKTKTNQKNYCEAKKIIRYTNKINNKLICRL